MPRSPEANQGIRDERRLQILRAAARVFARDGFSATQMDDVAREAGVSKGLIYHYFESKQTLFTAIVAQVVRGVIRLHEQAHAVSGRAADRLAWLVGEEVTGLRDGAHMFTVLLGAVEGAAVPKEAQQLVQDLTRESGQVLTDLLAAGQAEGDVVEGDPAELATLLGACLTGLALGAATPAFQASPPDASRLMRLFLRG